MTLFDTNTEADDTDTNVSDDVEALGNLIPLGFDAERDGVTNVHEAAQRILASNWMAERDRKVTDAALAPIERLLGTHAYGASLAAIERAIAQGRKAKGDI